MMMRKKELARLTKRKFFEGKEWKEEEDEYGYKEDIEQVDLEGREKKKASE